MNDFVKITVQTAGDLLEHMDLSEEEAEQQIDVTLHPAVVVEQLMKAAFNLDAVRLLAHALPKREAVWWACLAVRQNPIEEGSVEAQAITATEAWVRTPTEELRLLCRELAEKLKHKTPASWAAMAAAWSTGSLAPQDEPDVAPPEYLYAHAVGGAVNLAAVEGDADEAKNRYPTYFAQGFDLARGGSGQAQ
jgi:hypothetical protein